MSEEGLIDLNTTSVLLGIDKNEMCKILRQNNVFMQGTHPYKEFISCDYFKLKFKSYLKEKGGVGIATQTFVTTKGLKFLTKKLNHATIN